MYEVMLCPLSSGSRQGEVARISRGEFFGEQSLLHDAPRNATISAAGEVKCFELNREDFEKMVMGALQGPAQTALFLSCVPLLANLDQQRRLELASVVQVGCPPRNTVAA